MLKSLFIFSDSIKKTNKMNYTKIQKIISVILISFIFFWLVFRFPFLNFFQKTLAGDIHVSSLVSIIVSNDVYSDVKSSLKRYAKDIEGQLENTRVVIIPTPSDATAFQIASVNEKLYHEWYKGLKKNASFTSRLVGTVLVWNIPLPQVYDRKKSGNSILPYTDFDEKSFIFNHDSQRYEKNDNNINWVKADIWHGIIAPQTGNTSSDIELINWFFEKDHNFYEWTEQFENKKAVINWKREEKVHEKYEPYVLYFDQFREQAGLNYTKFKWYEAYLENKEDILYARYNQDLERRLREKFFGAENSDMSGLNLAGQFTSSNLNPSGGTDITTKFVIKELKKSFIEIINGAVIWEFRKDVHNAGRYNRIWWGVNVDTIPYLITVLDMVWDGVIKWVNNNLEQEINQLVATWWLSRNIAVATEIIEKGSPEANDENDWEWGNSLSCVKRYENIQYGRQWRNMLTAEDCTMFRWTTQGSGTLVEANRWLNIKNVERDLSLCSKAETSGYWWGNSPLNFDLDQENPTDLKLGEHDITKAIVPLYDPAWSKKVEDEALIPSPLNCYKNNYIVSYTEGEWVDWWNGWVVWEWWCDAAFQLPINGKNSILWFCSSENVKYEYAQNFDETYKRIKEWMISSCPEIVKLGSEVIVGDAFWSAIVWTDDTSSDCMTSYAYKEIDSYMRHVSPTPEELQAQTEAMISPNLPIDKNRYIDFIGAAWEYAKIEYPQLFRVAGEVSTLWDLDANLETIGQVLDEYLDAKSEEINRVIEENNPEGLEDLDLEIYEYLKIADYPEWEIDLKELLKNKPMRTFNVPWEEREISYYQTLLFSLFWNNLKSADAKYKFIFEHYLSDQFSDDMSFAFPKNKKMYEIAYLGAPWNTQSMAIWIDPEWKGENPFGDIISQNLDLSSSIFSNGVLNGWSLLDVAWNSSSDIVDTEIEDVDIEEDGDMFGECAPPEWVNIMEWFGAVTCWMEDMLPPKIHVGRSQCSSKTLFENTVGNSYEFPSLDKSWPNEGTLSVISSWWQLSCNLSDEKEALSTCLDQDLAGSRVVLSSSVQNIHYGKTGSLESKFFDSKSRLFTGLTHVKTYFELIKIVEPIDKEKELISSNARLVYEKENTKKNSKKIVQKYVTFSDQTSSLEGGLSTAHFSVKNKEAILTFKTGLIFSNNTGEEIKRISSNTLDIHIRGDIFTSQVQTIDLSWKTEDITNAAIASDDTNIFLIDDSRNTLWAIAKNIAQSSSAERKSIISLSHFTSQNEKEDLQYPLTVSIEKDNKVLREAISFNKEELAWYAWLYSLTEAGTYIFHITDWAGISQSREVEVLAWEPHNLDIKLWTSMFELWGAASSNLVILTDEFWNIIKGKSYQLEFSVEWDTIAFPNFDGELTNTFSASVFEWYKGFKLKPTGNIWTWRLLVSVLDDGKKLLTKSIAIETLDAIHVKLRLPSEKITVGKKDYNIGVEFRDSSWKILSDFSSTLYMQFDSVYGTLKRNIVTIEDWKANISLQTQTVSSEWVPFELKIEWLDSLIKKNIEIAPWKAIKTDIFSTQSYMSSDSDEKSTLTVELKDRYNNLVHTDNLTVLNIGLAENSNTAVRVSPSSQTVKWWRAQFQVQSTGIPWTASIKVTTTPSLSENSFIIWEWEEAETIHWIWENAIQIHTNFFWWKERSKLKGYNALYTVLLGADYGDFSQEGYLAGNLLFEKENRSLAVTSLLNNNRPYNDVVSISWSGWLKGISWNSDLTQDIVLQTWIDTSGRAYIWMYNDALHIKVWKIYFNFPEKVELQTCIWEENDFWDCAVSREKTSIILKSLSSDYKVSGVNNNLRLWDRFWEEILSIDENGKISKDSGIELQIDKGNTEDFTVFSLVKSGVIIAKMAFSFVNHRTLTTRNSQITELKLQKIKNSIITALESNRYSTRVLVQGKTAQQFIYYNDPFASTSSVNSFASNNMFGFEHFEKDGHIGWSDGNKSLLSFAAGVPLGKSIQEFASFGTVNLGDPVISLKKIQLTFKDSDDTKSFDATIWEIVARDIAGYRVFDYDKDEKDDILLLQTDGKFSLLERKWFSETFLKKWSLVNIVDIGNLEYVQAWDFTGDWYDDIFFVNSKWKPFLLNNHEKDFTRISLEESFWLAWKIVQSEWFDMDHDGKMDVTILDDSGNITIFYGGGTATSPEFTSLHVWSGYGVTLSSWAQNSGGVLYFDELKQIKDLSESERKSDWINYWLVNNLMFAQLTYQGRKKTFIKSEYTGVTGIEVEKFFTDRNGATLKSGDFVDVRVKITNTGDEIKNNILYLDNLQIPFARTEVAIETSKWEVERPLSGYDIAVWSIQLAPWEEAIISYELKVLPIKFGNIEVGLFEKDEVWDDEYWDILLKQSEKNCGKTLDIYRSESARSYAKGLAEPFCDESKWELPWIYEELSRDDNGNGIPDYIEEIQWTLDGRRQFMQDQLNRLNADRDGDGIVDREDGAPDINNAFWWDDFMSDLWNFDRSVDALSSEADNILEWLSCWFWWGECVSLPLNFAPFTAWKDLVLAGMPIGDGLRIDEGIPIFSALTWRQVWGTPPVCLPSVWFPWWGDSAAYVPWPACGPDSAGGSLWVWSAFNTFRLFATVTLTGWVGIAACFGWPARAVGNVPPQWVAPLAPWGNCIVAADQIVNTCSADGSDGDPGSLGLPQDFWGDQLWVQEGISNFGVINANCSTDSQWITSTDNTSIWYLNQVFAGNYYDFLNTERDTSWLAEDYRAAISQMNSEVANQQSTQGSVLSNNRPLFTLENGVWWEDWIQIELDISWDREGNFRDIVEIKQDRVDPFPDYLMNWVTRQIEEFVTKLTDLPTPFIILPDFSGVGGKTPWDEYHVDGFIKKFKEWVRKDKIRVETLEKQVELLERSKKSLDCNGKDEIRCLSIDIQISQYQAQDNAVVNGVWGVNSGIKSVFEFLWNLPLVQVVPQKVDVEIPLIPSQAALKKTIIEWEMVAKAWSESGDYGPLSVNAEYSDNREEFVASIYRNLEIIKSYHEIPRRLSKLLNQKEIRAEQMLCNIDSLASLFWKWIGINGARFKAWVDLYILIKAVLKSWQAMVDVFINYDEECHDCKNERDDLLYYQFKIIDVVIPKFPVIEFPKWPDIILDLHNIRAGLTMVIPDINLTFRTIVLPSLTLPQFDINGRLSINIPLLPLLEELPEIPNLPDLPTLPSVELPNLPPPPKLPELWPKLAGILDIIKLILKAMCILKFNPLVPEWRSWDQITFLTERKGYLPTDFLHLTIPDLELSLPKIADAIKISTWVNLEDKEMDDRLNIARRVDEIIAPWNSYSNNIVNIFTNNGYGTIDWKDLLDDAWINTNVDVDVDINEDGVEIDANVSVVDIFNGLWKKLSSSLQQMEQKKDSLVDTKEFMSLMNAYISDNNLARDPDMENFVWIWSDAQKYTHSKEDKKIAELKKTHKGKMDALRGIINRELQKTRILKEQIPKLFEENSPTFLEVIWERKTADFVDYNNAFKWYNKKFLLAAKDLVDGTPDPELREIQSKWKSLLKNSQGLLQRYKKNTNVQSPNKSSRLLALESTNQWWKSSETSQNSCQKAQQATYKHNYKWLYIIEKQKSYRLFDYLDELVWNEEYNGIDYDADGDTDLLYFVNGTLYLKKNLQIQNKEKYFSPPALTIPISKNYIYNGGWFIESVNGFKEVNPSSKIVNISFQALTNPLVEKYRFEYVTTVDKDINGYNVWYVPKEIYKHVVDGFVWLDSVERWIENESRILTKNPVSIRRVRWGLPWVELKTYEMLNIATNLNQQNIKTITTGTLLYAAVDDVTIEYHTVDVPENNIEIIIPKRSAMEFKDSIIITAASANLYVKGHDFITLTWKNEIQKYAGLPFFDETKITSDPTKIHDESVYIELIYDTQDESYFNSTEISSGESVLDFSEVVSYELVDLGTKSSDYLIQIERPNDYYYGKMYALWSEKRWTYSSQQLFSPQKEADTSAPEIHLSWGIKIPVYQKKRIDLTASLSDNSWFEAIKKIGIDLDLNIDSDGDGDPRNDFDSGDFTIIKTAGKISVEFWPFDSLFSKKIGIILEDEVGNIWVQEIDFSVYAPIPEITLQEWNEIHGRLNEVLVWEPVSLYRVRWGAITKLQDISGKEIKHTFEWGVYNFELKGEPPIWAKPWKLSIKQGWWIIAYVNETTWKITKNDDSIGIEVDISDKWYPNIHINESSWKEIYNQFVHLANNRNIENITNFEDIISDGMYVKMWTNNFSYYSIPSGVKYNAWAFVIYEGSDLNKQALFTLFPDGRIDTHNWNYTLEYKSFWEYAWFILKQSPSTKIAELIIHIKWKYVIQ